MHKLILFTKKIFHYFYFVKLFMKNVYKHIQVMHKVYK